MPPAPASLTHASGRTRSAGAARTHAEPRERVRGAIRRSVHRAALAAVIVLTLAAPRNARAQGVPSSSAVDVVDPAAVGAIPLAAVVQPVSPPASGDDPLGPPGPPRDAVL